MMAQVIRTLCDEHLARDEEVDGATFSLSLRLPGEREQTFDVDLCDVCVKPLLELREWLAEKGRKQSRPYKQRSAAGNGVDKPATSKPATATPADAAEDTVCPICGYEAGGLEPVKYVTKHMRQQHGTSLAEYRGEPLPFVCEICDAGFTSKSALGAHKARSKDHR